MSINPRVISRVSSFFLSLFPLCLLVLQPNNLIQLIPKGQTLKIQNIMNNFESEIFLRKNYSSQLQANAQGKFHDLSGQLPCIVNN